VVASKGRRRLLVIGLDGATPEFMFDRFRSMMPATSALIERGLRAPLRTTDPPLSVPAWPVMFTGVDPGTLGVYGFRHRKDHSYTVTYVPTSALPVPSVWQIASGAGLRVGSIGMPLGYPPVPLNGFSISDFLTPPGTTVFTSPPELGVELEAKYGPYPFDVVFRTDERKDLFGEIVRMTETRFRIARDLISREPWDLFGIHEIGSDRLNHAYWKYFDEAHPDFVPNSPYANVARDYYQLLDREIASLIAAAGDTTSVMIVSDHGSMAMHGLFCINQWLAEKRYLVLRTPPARGTTLEKSDVDWDRTLAWGSGGYYARIFFNVRGREARGIVSHDQLPVLRRRLEADLAGIRGPDGSPLAVRVLDPKTEYAEVRGDAPDLMVYFGDLKWRSAGTMGHPTNYLRENDIGPDDAVHSVDGVFLFADPTRPRADVELPTQNIRDVTPTILQYLGLPIPPHIQGKPIDLA
jgi:predicted AlkP superfamily phosphohydrolase/phosphomutase